MTSAPRQERTNASEINGTFQTYAPSIGSDQLEFSFALRQGLSASIPAKAASAPTRAGENGRAAEAHRSAEARGDPGVQVIQNALAPHLRHVRREAGKGEGLNSIPGGRAPSPGYAAAMSS